MVITTLKEFYKGKKVFLTGHTGFKGSWLLLWLKQMGCVVKGFSLPPNDEQSLFNIFGGNSLCNSIFGDIRDKELLKAEVLAFKPDIFFHLAAQPLVINSYQDPVYTHEVNVLGTANTLDAIRCLGKPCIGVFITTDKVYFNDEKGIPYKESDRLGGFDPYSASKASAEIVIDSYRQSYFPNYNLLDHKVSISVARAGNVIGGGDWSENRIVPDLVKSIMLSEELLVRNHHAVRPWQHVLEPLGGYLKLAFLQSNYEAIYSDAFNFGPNHDETVTVEELIRISIAHWGKGKYRIQQSSTVYHEAGQLKLNIEKASSLLSWKPLYKASEAIQKTIEWYKTLYNNPNSIYDLSIQQITDYEGYQILKY
jgi:CDP-glucose 4,6-dehydratase